MNSFQTGRGWLALQEKLFPRSRSSFPWALFFPSQMLQGNEDSRARNWLEKKLQWNCPVLKVIWILYDILCDILWPEICTLLRTWNVQRIAMPWNSRAPKLSYILWSLHWQNRIDLSLLSRILPSSVTLPLNNFLELDAGHWLHSLWLLSYGCNLWYCLADDLIWQWAEEVRKLKSS